MAEIIITANGLTEREMRKVLTMVRNLRRKRRTVGAEELRYQPSKIILLLDRY